MSSSSEPLNAKAYLYQPCSRGDVQTLHFLCLMLASQVFLHESAGSCKTTFSVMFLVIICDEKYVALQRESALSSGISPSVSARSRTCPNPAGVGQYKTNSVVFLWAFCFIYCCFCISVLLLESKKMRRSWERGNMKSMYEEKN